MVKKQGFALVLAIFIMLFISITFVAVFYMLTTDLQIADNQQMDTKALYIADAGIEDAINRLQLTGGSTIINATVIFPDPAEQALPGGGAPTAYSNYCIIYPWPAAGQPDPYPALGPKILSSATLSNGLLKEIIAAVSVSGSGPYNVEVKVWMEGSG